MIKTNAYAVHSAKDKLSPYQFERRAVGADDILIEIAYCGVCHSDIHQVRNEWGGSIYPMVPGHEIVGKVKKIGENVKNFREGDLAGVGCMVDSCRKCESCQENLEQFCAKGASMTYSSYEQDKETITQGGYSQFIVVNQDFCLKVSDKLDLARVAPLLCAGITTYSPLKLWRVKKGQKVGIVGLGGLGHMAIKFAVAFGAEVTLFTHSPSKREDAVKLGAHQVIVTQEDSIFQQHQNEFDLILDTVSAEHDINLYLPCLKRDGVMVLVGVPDKPLPLVSANLIIPRRKLVGSLIGGIKETQEMLDFCAEHNIMSDIELINIQAIDKAYERMLRSDVKYRFVIDMQSLQA